MPFQPGRRLPGERASKVGHLDVLKNPLVNELSRTFTDAKATSADAHTLWTEIKTKAEPLSIVFCADGSWQTIVGESPPYSARAFIKTALVRLDEYALAKVDKESPNPFVLRDILKESAMHHATLFPLRHVVCKGKTLYDAIRHAIFVSLKDDHVLESQPYETFKWIVYQKWDQSENRAIPPFECPHCAQNTTLAFDADTGGCVACGKEVFSTDMLGFHQEMAPDAAQDSVASSYMSIHETLMLLTGVRYFWERNKKVLGDCLFIKDGPLSIRAQYSKLVQPIRQFVAFAKSRDWTSTSSDKRRRARSQII